MSLTHDYPADYRPLCQRLGFDQGIPWTPIWSAEADFLNYLEAELTQRPAQVLLECGSGLSTLVLARLLQRQGQGKLYSLENGADHAAASRQALDAYGLTPWVEVIHAPLRDVTLEAGTWQWYDPAKLPAAPLELVVIDGPPGRLQPLSRYPALPLLADRLAPGCRILLDDAARPDERQAVVLWLQRFPNLKHHYLPNRRGCSRLELLSP